MLGSIWVAAGLAVVAQGGSSLSLKEVAQANAASVAGIRSLVIKVKTYQSNPGGDPDALSLTNEYTYRVQGDEERMTLDTPQAADPSGDKPGYSDAYNGPGGFREIAGYDPKRPASLGEYSLTRTQGQLSARKTDGQSFAMYPRWDLLFEVYKKPKYLLLKDLIAQSKSARLAATPSTSPRRCYEIEVVLAEGVRLISVDPAANFMVRCMEFRLPPPSTSKPSSVEVASFRACGDGVFIPEVVNAESQLEGGRETKVLRGFKVRTECEVVSCNQPIPAEDFRVAFPDWLRVVNQGTGKIHYWGPDEKPRLTFDTAEEHRRWFNPRLAKAMRAQQRSGFPWFGALAGFAAVALAAVALRSLRHRERNAGHRA